VLSAACYQLAADASPWIVERRRDRGSEAPSSLRGERLSREQEVLLMGTLQTSPRVSPAVLARAGKGDRPSRR